MPPCRLSPGQLVALATDVADGLSYMEASGYLHKYVHVHRLIAPTLMCIMRFGSVQLQYILTCVHAGMSLPGTVS